MASLVPAFLSNTDTFTVTASSVAQDYTVSIGLPPSYATANRAFPVVYVLDGNLQFPLVKSVCEILWLGKEIPEAVLVGIGYPVNRLAETIPLRTRDLTPTVKGPGTGGAPDFLNFIQRELIPLVDLNYRTDPKRRVLFGNSRGGLFALYALFTAPGLFQRYLIGSPSIWWDDKALYSIEERFAAQHADLSAHLFISAGSLEAESMIGDMSELISRLRDRKYPSLTLDANVFEGETHFSVIPETVSRGLKSTLAVARP